jgi:hypothetical protein
MSPQRRAAAATRGLSDEGFGSSGGASSDAPASPGRSVSGGGRNRTGGGDAGGDDSVVLHGVTLYVRGLRALAQTQGLPPDYYTPTGPGAAAGATLEGNSYNTDSVYVGARRALQRIGAELASGQRTTTTTISPLSDASYVPPPGAPDLPDETCPFPRGYIPDEFVKLLPSVDIMSPASGGGIAERRCGCAECVQRVVVATSPPPPVLPPCATASRSRASSSSSTS